MIGYLADLHLPPGQCRGLLVDAGNGRGGGRSPGTAAPPPRLAVRGAAAPPRLAVDGADQVAAVVRLHVALAVCPAAADVGLGLQTK